MQRVGPGRRQPGLGGQVCPLAIRRTALPTGSELSLSLLAEGKKKKNLITHYIRNTVTIRTE